jgi:allantoate deiminase
MRSFDGETMGEAMRTAGLDPARIPEARRDDLAAFLKLHVEQGPVLERAGAPVAIVAAITGYRQYGVELRRTANHAGACPMDLRRDPMAAVAIVAGVIGEARRLGRRAVTTIDRMLVEPNSRAVVPEGVTFTIDARHPDPSGLRALCEHHEGLIEQVAARHALEVTVRIDSDRPPCPCDPDLVARLQAAAAALALQCPTMASGAVHDAQQLAAICPVAMVYVQSRGGLSHTPAEFTATEHARAGVEVLATALHDLAY